VEKAAKSAAAAAVATKASGGGADAKRRKVDSSGAATPAAAGASSAKAPVGVSGQPAAGSAARPAAGGAVETAGPSNAPGKAPAEAAAGPKKFRLKKGQPAADAAEVPGPSAPPAARQQRQPPPAEKRAAATTSASRQQPGDQQPQQPPAPLPQLSPDEAAAAIQQLQVANIGAEWAVSTAAERSSHLVRISTQLVEVRKLAGKPTCPFQRLIEPETHSALFAARITEPPF